MIRRWGLGFQLNELCKVMLWLRGDVRQNFIGANNMSALSLRLPDSIHRHIKEFAQKKGVSINQFIATAVGEKNIRIGNGRLFAS